MRTIHTFFLVLLLAGLSFVQAQTKLTSPNLIGTTTSWGSNNPIDLNQALDGDLTTFIDTYDNWGFVGYDFGNEGAVVDKMKYAPRTGWASRLNGAVLRGSNSSNFLNEFDVLYTISETPSEEMLTEAIVAAPKAYRYVYLFLNSGTYSNISEFELYDANPSKLSGTLIGSGNGSEWCETCTPDKATDGDFSTYVEGPKTIGFVGYDFGEGTEATVTSWKYAPRSGYASRLNGSVLCGSNNPDYLSSYTVLSTISSDPLVGVLTEQTIADANKYRYIFWMGGVNSYGNIAEMELYFQTEPALSVSKKEITLDTYYPAESFFVASSNLTEEITVSAPIGIVVEPNVITKNREVEVYAFWDGSEAVDGDIVLTSGTGQATIKIKCADDTQCYVPYSTEDMNYVVDPGMNNLVNFSGWGTKSVINIINDPANVYCGATSVSVGDSLNLCSGSIDVTLTGAFEPNATYLVRAMVKTVDGSFQFGVWGWSEGQPDINNLIDTQGEWQQVEFTFTTGTSFGSSSGMFVNNCGSSTGTRAYVDNWEMYNLVTPVISTSKDGLVFDPEYNSAQFTILGNNLTENLSIVAPAGITVNPSTIEIDEDGKVLGDTVLVLWDGISEINDSITITSSGKTSKIGIYTTKISNTDCFIPLYESKQNLIGDTYLNDLANFGGWGNRKMITVVEQPDSVYCGSHSIKIEGSGSLDWILTGKLEKNSTYIARAMVRSFGGEFQLGSWGAIASIDTIGHIFNGFTDKSVLFDTHGEWAPVTMQFVTSDTIDENSVGIYFNNYYLSGQACFIDNWEMYQMYPTALFNPEVNSTRVYLRDGKIDVEYLNQSASEANITVYSLSGTSLFSVAEISKVGKNTKTLPVDLPAGVYLVKTSINNKTAVAKIIK